MKKVLEMREKRAKAWDAAKAFLDTRAKDGVLSAEDNATYDKMLADVDAMARQIKRRWRTDADNSCILCAGGKPIGFRKSEVAGTQEF